jgi:elongation factor Ts
MSRSSATLTGAGMMDCKKALEESGGDFDKAVEFLRVKGAKDVGKRAGRTAANGIVAHAGSALLELNCETDFVAKTPDFVALGQQLVEFGAQNAIADAAALQAATLPDGRAVADVVQDFAAKIGEKIVVNRFAEARWHGGGLPAPQGAGSAAAGRRAGRVCREDRRGRRRGRRGIAMQIAAMRPKFLTREDVPAETSSRSGASPSRPRARRASRSRPCPRSWRAG